MLKLFQFFLFCIDKINDAHKMQVTKRVGLRPQKETTPKNLAFHGFKQKTQIKHETAT